MASWLKRIYRKGAGAVKRTVDTAKRVVTPTKQAVQREPQGTLPPMPEGWQPPPPPPAPGGTMVLPDGQVVSVDSYLKQKALQRGETVQAAAGDRRLYLEQPYGSLLSTERTPPGGTERGQAVRELAEREGISHGKAGRMYDAQQRQIRRLARSRGITNAEAQQLYLGAQPGAAGGAEAAEPTTPREALEQQLSGQAMPLQTGQMTYAQAALQLDPAAIAGDRINDPVIADMVKQANHIRRAIAKGVAPAEEGYRKLMELLRLVASDTPLADPSVTQGMELFGEGGDWLTYYSSEAELADPQNDAAIGRAQEEVSDIMADPGLSAEDKVAMARKVGEGLRSTLGEAKEDVAAKQQQQMGASVLKGASSADEATRTATLEWLETHPDEAQALYAADPNLEAQVGMARAAHAEKEREKLAEAEVPAAEKLSTFQKEGHAIELFSSAEQLSDPAYAEANNRYDENVGDILASDFLTDDEKLEACIGEGEKLRKFRPEEPEEAEEPAVFGQYRATPTQMMTAIDNLLMTEEEDDEYPVGSVYERVKVARAWRRDITREPNEDEIADRLETAHDKYIARFSELDVPTETLEAHWRATLTARGELMQTWEKHHRAGVAEGVVKRLKAGESMEDVETSLTDDQIDSLTPAELDWIRAVKNGQTSR